MTAEVAILNRYGIAIAADSAVTIGEERVWKTTNKIFSLGPRNDIAIMIYGSGDFAGFPWEVVVKSFKRENSKTSFKTVQECEAAFLGFLTDARWRNKIQSALTPLTIFVSELSDLRDLTKGMGAREFRSSVQATLRDWMDVAINREECIVGLDKEEFIKEFRQEIDSLRKESFPEHFPSYLAKLLDDYLHEYFIRAECETDYKSGVVFCGFGLNEHQPALRELFVDGRYRDYVRAWNGRRVDPADSEEITAQIIPFAQRDMTNLFMEGISSAYSSYFVSIITGIMDKKTKDIVSAFPGDDDEKLVEKIIQERLDADSIKKISKDFKEFRASKFIWPLMSNVASLPREEMAAMAESLVELTSLRRKIDSTLQSVAGPVDVAFISKPDGFIWIKRKHYFDKVLNEEFFSRKALWECPE